MIKSEIYQWLFLENMFHLKLNSFKVSVIVKLQRFNLKQSTAVVIRKFSGRRVKLPEQTIKKKNTETSKRFIELKNSS